MNAESSQNKIVTKELVSNKKALFQYELLETLEVGISLLGTEIKSLKDHGGGLQEAYVVEEGGELWLLQSTIAPYKFGASFNHEERRKRKLLAHKREIAQFAKALQERGLSCVPLSMYLKNGKVKVKIALVKGKKAHDKREAIKEREDKRQMQRMMKNHS